MVFATLLLAGFVQRAQAGDGIVALQTADPSCPDDSGNIYVDCGNGTVTDNRTGLVWLANANCYGVLDSHEAVEIVANLSDIPAGSVAAAHDCGLSDGSSPGEWRLPSLDDWEEMIDDARGQGGDPDCVGGSSAPTITNDSGGGCWVSGPSSFSGVQPSRYWSSTTRISNPAQAWGVNLQTGDPNNILPRTFDLFVWPVRAGQ